MPKKTDLAKKNYIKFQYCTRPITPEQLAEESRVSASTIYRWIRDEKWEDDRTCTQNSAWENALWIQKKLDALIKQIDEENRLPNNSETDMIVKWSKSIRELSGGTHYVQVMFDVLAKLVDEVKLLDPSLGDKLVPYVSNYAERVSKEKSR